MAKPGQWNNRASTRIRGRVGGVVRERPEAQETYSAKSRLPDLWETKPGDSRPFSPPKGNRCLNFFLKELEEVRAILFEELLQRHLSLKEQTVPKVFHGSDRVEA